MRLRAALCGGLLLLCDVLAGSLGTHRHDRHSNFHGAKRRAQLDARRPQSGRLTSAAMSASTWNAQAGTTCASQLDALNGTVRNPAGLAVCYKVPYMDNTTGVFEAELRLYALSEPTGDWAGITTKDMTMSLSYLGATIQRLNDNPVSTSKRGATAPEIDKEQSSPLVQRQASSAKPPELGVMSFVGMLNDNVKGPQLDLPQIQALLVPGIELSGVDPATKRTAEMMLTSREATFMSGVFSEAGMSPTTPEAAASASAAANSAAPFVIPGVSVQIPLIGLGVTMVWVGLFVGAVGLGTVNRVQYRNQYYRRMKREAWSDVRGG